MIARILIGYVLCCAAALADGIPAQSYDALKLQHLDEPAPDFAIGGGQRLSSLGGRWVLLHFGATWCVPCRREMPALDRLYIRWHDGVDFVVVAIDEQRDGRVAAFAQSLGLHMPLLNLDAAAATPRYWTWGVPVTYLINPAGNIVARAMGDRDWDGPAAAALMQSLAGTD